MVWTEPTQEETTVPSEAQEEQREGLTPALALALALAWRGTRVWEWAREREARRRRLER